MMEVERISGGKVKLLNCYSVDWLYVLVYCKSLLIWVSFLRFIDLDFSHFDINIGLDFLIEQSNWL